MEWIFCLVVTGAIAAVIYAYGSQNKNKNYGSEMGPPRSTQRSASSTGVSISMPVGGQRIPVRGSTKTTQAEFVCQTKPITIAGRDIPAPLLYVTKRADGNLTNSGVVDLSLPVARRAPAHPHDLPYWPSYSGLSPQQRATYLDWLSGGRKAPILAGYVFLFFYGLERRLIIGRDRIAIRAELDRLLGIYGDNNSFQGYAIRLLVFDALRALTTLTERELGSAFPFGENGWHNHQSALGGRLAWYALKQKPLPVDLAIAAASSDPRTTNSIVARRVSEEMATLFSKRYHETFGEGLILKPGKDSVFEYSPAASTLRYELEATGHRDLLKSSYPDPRSDTRQFRRLADLYDECIDELRSYSRAVGASGKDLTPEKWEKLPPELKAEVPHPHAKLWGTVTRRYLNENGVVTPPAGTVAQLCGISERNKLTRTQCRKISKTAADLGFVVEPNPDILPQSWKWNDKISLVGIENAGEEPSARYKVASLLTYLGVYIAGADGVVDDEELKVIHDTLDDMFDLADSELRRIDGLITALSDAKISMRGVSELVEEHLFKAQREQLGELLILVAVADGKLDKDEKKYLKRAFNALDLNPDEAVRKAEEMLADDTPPLADPISVRWASDDNDGEVIPPPKPSVPEQKPAVVLNAERISQIRRETREVADMLGKALGGEGEGEATSEPEDDAVISEPRTAEVHREESEEARFTGLQERYIPFVEAVIEQREWTEDDLRELAGENRLMLAAAISVVNEWSDKHLGGFLIQDADPYRIRIELLQQEETHA